MKIKDLRNIINNRYKLVDKSVGVELVELGFFSYSKLTAKNYDYWWYEVADGEKIDKKAFTYCWSDLKRTRKFQWIINLIDFHDDNESMFVMITNILNIVSAETDGVCKYTKIPAWLDVYNFYYQDRKPIDRQLDIFDEVA